MKHSYQATLLQVFLLAFVIIGISLGNTAFAATLNEAKAQGFVGETGSGYLGLVTPSAPPEIKALMNEINGKRKSTYQEIAKRNKTNLKAVEALAAKTAISKTKAGHYVQLPNGSWQKK